MWCRAHPVDQRQLAVKWSFSMNETSHANIMLNAYLIQTEELRTKSAIPPTLLRKAGNYPDYFDAPTVSDEKRCVIDPDWKKFIQLPPGLPAERLHFVSAPIADTFARIPIYDYYFRQMIAELRKKNYHDFIKFAGCLSHAVGDATQPAHIGPDANNLLLSHMLPVPDTPGLENFHYHTTVEAVTGQCADLPPPCLLGLSPQEAAWKLASETRKAIIYCRRFIIPIIQAVFANDQDKAESLAAEPVTIAAQLTADAIHTAYCIAEGTAGDLPDEDLRQLPPIEEFHDYVYGGVVLDGNKKVPPNNVPVTPGVLKINGENISMPGLGMLPHSGMNGDKVCFMTWQIPRGVFKTFSAWAGLHSQIGTGAVEFRVQLDGITVWSSGKLEGGSEAVKCEIKLYDAEKLTIQVWAAGDESNFWNNHSYWGNPVLNR